MSGGHDEEVARLRRIGLRRIAETGLLEAGGYVVAPGDSPESTSVLAPVARSDARLLMVERLVRPPNATEFAETRALFHLEYEYGEEVVALDSPHFVNEWGVSYGFLGTSWLGEVPYCDQVPSVERIGRNGYTEEQLLLDAEKNERPGPPERLREATPVEQMTLQGFRRLSGKGENGWFELREDDFHVVVHIEAGRFVNAYVPTFVVEHEVMVRLPVGDARRPVVEVVGVTSVSRQRSGSVVTVEDGAEALEFSIGWAKFALTPWAMGAMNIEIVAEPTPEQLALPAGIRPRAMPSTDQILYEMEDSSEKSITEVDSDFRLAGMLGRSETLRGLIDETYALMSRTGLTPYDLALPILIIKRLLELDLHRQQSGFDVENINEMSMGEHSYRVSIRQSRGYQLTSFAGLASRVTMTVKTSESSELLPASDLGALLLARFGFGEGFYATEYCLVPELVVLTFGHLSDRAAANGVSRSDLRVMLASRAAKALDALKEGPAPAVREEPSAQRPSVFRSLPRPTSLGPFGASRFADNSRSRSTDNPGPEIGG